MGLFGKKYKCDTCGAKFDSQEKLMAHSKTHMAPPAGASVNAFKCSTCGASFGSQSELMEHSRNAHRM